MGSSEQQEPPRGGKIMGKDRISTSQIKHTKQQLAINEEIKKKSALKTKGGERGVTQNKGAKKSSASQATKSGAKDPKELSTRKLALQ